MNKTTRPIEDNEYDAIIETIRDGFEFRGISHKPNPRIAMALQLERNLGLRISDVLRLTLDSFVRVGDKYRINIYEKKTGKYRCSKVSLHSKHLYNLYLNYCSHAAR